jgi:hypothetical protein
LIWERRNLGETFINSFFGRFAVSRARSLLAYRFDMSRRSLRGSLRCPRDTVGRSPLARERGAAGLPAPNASHLRVRPAIPKKQISKGFTSAATFYNALF